MAPKVKIDISHDGMKVSAASQSNLNISYGWFNGGRISQVGSVSLSYGLNGRITSIGRLSVVYGWGGNVSRIAGTDDRVEVFIHTESQYAEDFETRKHRR